MAVARKKFDQFVKQEFSQPFNQMYETQFSDLDKAGKKGEKKNNSSLPVVATL